MGWPKASMLDQPLSASAPWLKKVTRPCALIDRKSFYRLAEIGCEEEVDGVRQFGVWSGGAFFPLVPVAELPAD